MEPVSISAAKARLNDLVEQAVTTHEHVTITKNGAPAAVMVSADEWQAIQETLFWLSQDDVRDEVERGRAEDESGEVYEVREDEHARVLVHRVDHRARVYRPR